MVVIKRDIHFFRQFCNPNYSLTQLELDCHGVMVALVVEDALLFVKRSHSMPSHKGQVALIGGHRSGDEKFPLETAMREFFEETNLSLDHFEFITALPTVSTSRDVSILPVLAIYHQDRNYLETHLQTNGEWEVAFLVELSYLFNQEYWVEANRISMSQRQNLLFCSLAEQDIKLLKGKPQYPLVLWGASARVVDHLKNLILTKS
jgi:8-oxo-dGTP pyrophosphatase MutT (NUDIX family)